MQTLQDKEQDNQWPLFLKEPPQDHMQSQELPTHIKNLFAIM